ncbi:hypothetical protein HRbin19_00932 [bacterium HR19]|nr:hypothetical protein HRbin19_00932 [bacterium HR19]
MKRESFFINLVLFIFSFSLIFPYIYLNINYGFPFSITGDEDNWVAVFFHSCGICEVQAERCFSMFLFSVLCKLIKLFLEDPKHTVIFLKIIGCFAIVFFLFWTIKNFIKDTSISLLALAVSILTVGEILRFSSGKLELNHSPFFGFIISRGFNPNPLIAVFLFFSLLVSRWLSSQEKLTLSQKIVLAIAFGLNFWGQFYYYVHALLFVVLLLIFDSRRRKEVFEFSFLAFFIALPALIHNFLQTNYEHTDEMLQRGILLTPFRAKKIDFLLEKKNYIILFLSFISVFYILKFEKEKNLFFFWVSSVVLGFQNFITGITVQERHFYYAFYLFSVIAIFYFLKILIYRLNLMFLKKFISALSFGLFLYPVIFFSVFLLKERFFIERMGIFSHIRKQIELKDDFEKICGWIKDNRGKIKTLSVPSEITPILFRICPYSTYLDVRTYIFIPIDEDEIFRRRILNVKFQGLDIQTYLSELEKYFDLVSDFPDLYEIRGVLTDLSGLPHDLKVKLKDRFEKNFLKIEYENSLRSEFLRLEDIDELKNSAISFGLSHVIREKQKEEKEFYLKEVFRTQKFFVYEISFN